jgi:hypothetical protein
MKKTVIFGSGYNGVFMYHKLYDKKDIIYFVDNNPKLANTIVQGIQVIDFEKFQNIYSKEIDIYICAGKYYEIASQLRKAGIFDYYISIAGFIYSTDKEGNLVSEKENYSIHKTKKESGKKSVLFVQRSACIRTHKIARALKNNGHNVYLAYIEKSPKQFNSEYSETYDKIIPVFSMPDLIYLVNNSDFDFVHSSNTPDYLTMLLVQSNKPLIHDCHDFSSLYIKMSSGDMMVEYIANTQSAGTIYTTEEMRKEAIKKFQIKSDKTFVLENFITEELSPTEKLKKLSDDDGMLHCVYEGGVLSGEFGDTHRYFEKIWILIANQNVHVHFYTNCEPNYCNYLDSLHENIHYEGNKSSKRLAVEMSQYDVGLSILNVTKKNKQYLELASPNKIQEYINAGIPVAVGNIESQRRYVEDNEFGKQIELNGNIFKQIQEVANIQIPKNILRKKNFTMESKVPELLSFYERCLM